MARTKVLRRPAAHVSLVSANTVEHEVRCGNGRRYLKCLHPDEWGQFYREAGERSRTVCVHAGSYMELLRGFARTLSFKALQLEARAKRYAVGLQRLNETTEMVSKLQQELAAMEPVLKKKSEDVARLLEHLAEETKKGEKAEQVASAEQNNAEQRRSEVQVIKRDCEKDLNKVMPAYFAALNALEALDKRDLTEIKSFAHPPKLVEDVLAAVLVLHKRPTAWAEAKKFLGASNLIQNLKDYDKDHIEDAVIKKLDKYLVDPDFLPAKVSAVSKAATSLCMWVRAVDVYHRVLRHAASSQSMRPDRSHREEQK